MTELNIKKELEDNQILVLLLPSIDYNKDIVKIVKILSDKKILYVTLNKTHESLIEIFKKSKIDVSNITYIDAISKTFKLEHPPTENCHFCSSPGSLTELSLLINKLLKGKFDYLIFDSITSLLIYEKDKPVAKFISDIMNKLKSSETKAIFYALDVKEHESTLKECCMFADNAINLKEVENIN